MKQASVAFTKKKNIKFVNIIQFIWWILEDKHAHDHQHCSSIHCAEPTNYSTVTIWLILFRKQSSFKLQQIVLDIEHRYESLQGKHIVLETKHTCTLSTIKLGRNRLHPFSSRYSTCDFLSRALCGMSRTSNLKQQLAI